MLKGSLPPYLDARNEENSFYITLSNGPHTYVAESTNTEPENYNHNLEDVYFITPILCKHCEDYIWGSGKVGVACKVSNYLNINIFKHGCCDERKKGDEGEFTRNPRPLKRYTTSLSFYEKNRPEVVQEEEEPSRKTLNVIFLKTRRLSSSDIARTTERKFYEEVKRLQIAEASSKEFEDGENDDFEAAEEKGSSASTVEKER
ncbi:hypothetical protein HZH66_006728 [Vespula vulgaris]|uniref:Uncharacterized protein n=1 Tax=Vespula vulgaris TaxID=7454 RepID=A0A834K433_VESVU|nr:hypothetical protein HZH66_006728 [Vespula vulgaris]